MLALHLAAPDLDGVPLDGTFSPVSHPCIPGRPA